MKQVDQLEFRSYLKKIPYLVDKDPEDGLSEKNPEINYLSARDFKEGKITKVGKKLWTCKTVGELTLDWIEYYIDESYT